MQRVATEKEHQEQSQRANVCFEVRRNFLLAGSSPQCNLVYISCMIGSPGVEAYWLATNNPVFADILNPCNLVISLLFITRNVLVTSSAGYSATLATSVNSLHFGGGFHLHNRPCQPTAPTTTFSLKPTCVPCKRGYVQRQNHVRSRLRSLKKSLKLYLVMVLLSDGFSRTCPSRRVQGH